MAADPNVGLLLDRRSPSSGRPFPTALTPIGEVGLRAGSSLSAWLVRASEGTTLPRRVESSGFGVQLRLLDRFYLPDVANEDIVQALFETVATIYDLITDLRVNLTTAAELLKEATHSAGPNPLILDFGCGTGVAFNVVRQHGTECRLLGTDISVSMLRLAEARGETVIKMDQWREKPPAVDGAIACFVLHYGVHEADFGRLASSLRPNGIFAANMFRMSDEKMAAVDAALDRLGLTPIKRRPVEATQRLNLLASYRKRP